MHNHEVLIVPIDGGLKRYIEHLAKRENMSEQATVRWLIREARVSGNVDDIEVPEDTTNIELDGGLEDVLKFAKACLQCDGDVVEYENCGYKGTVTRQQLIDGIARLEKKIAEDAG